MHSESQITVKISFLTPTDDCSSHSFLLSPIPAFSPPTHSNAAYVLHWSESSNTCNPIMQLSLFSKPNKSLHISVLFLLSAIWVSSSLSPTLFSWVWRGLMFMEHCEQRRKLLLSTSNDYFQVITVITRRKIFTIWKAFWKLAPLYQTFDLLVKLSISGELSSLVKFSGCSQNNWSHKLWEPDPWNSSVFWKVP